MAAKRKTRTRLWPYFFGVVAGGLAVGMVLTYRPTFEPTEDGPPVRFIDVTKASGIRFVHHSGASPTKLWLKGGLPGGKTAREPVPGTLRQETFIRVYIPIRPTAKK